MFIACKQSCVNKGWSALPCIAGYSTQSRMHPSSCKSHLHLPCTSPIHAVLAYAVMSSRHLRVCRPLFLFLILGCHSVNLFVHLFSSFLAVCPAHLHMISFILFYYYVLYFGFISCIRVSDLIT